MGKEIYTLWCRFYWDGWVGYFCLFCFLNEISYRVVLDRLRIVPENPGFGLGS